MSKIGYAGCPQGRPCLKLGYNRYLRRRIFFSSSHLQICTLITRDAPRADRVKFSVGYLFFFFVVVTICTLIYYTGWPQGSDREGRGKKNVVPFSRLYW